MLYICIVNVLKTGYSILTVRLHNV